MTPKNRANINLYAKIYMLRDKYMYNVCYTHANKENETESHEPNYQNKEKPKQNSLENSFSFLLLVYLLVDLCFHNFGLL